MQSEDGHDVISTGKPVHLYDPRELGLEPGLSRSWEKSLQNAWAWQYGVFIELEDIKNGATP